MRVQNTLANVDEESEDIEMTTSVKRRLGMHSKPLVAGPPPSAEVRLSAMSTTTGSCSFP